MSSAADADVVRARGFHARQLPGVVGVYDLAHGRALHAVGRDARRLDDAEGVRSQTGRDHGPHALLQDGLRCLDARAAGSVERRIGQLQSRPAHCCRPRYRIEHLQT